MLLQLKLIVRYKWCCKAKSFLEWSVFILSSSVKLSLYLLMIQERPDLVLTLWNSKLRDGRDHFDTFVFHVHRPLCGWRYRVLGV